MTKTLTAENFQTEVLDSSLPVLVDFWASWCGPCQMIGPVIEEISQELEGKALVGKVNVDENQDLAQKYGVMSIPTIILFKDGKEQEKIIGLTSKQQLLELILKAL